MTLGENINFYRRRLGLSQEELAQRVGVSRQAVSKWELNETTPEVTKLVALAEVFGITTDQLLKGEAPEETAQTVQGVEPSSLPGFLDRMIRRHGWLAGVYIALQGLGVAVVGGIARFRFGRMLQMVANDMQSPWGPGVTVSGSPPPEVVKQIAESLGGSGSFSSMGRVFITIPTVIMAIGLLVMAAGIVLAAVLYRRGREKK